MTLADLIVEIQEGLKFRTDLRENIIRRINRVQSLLESAGTMPWFLLVEDAEVPVLANSDAVLPTDFLSEPQGNMGSGPYFRGSSDPNAAYVYLRKLPAKELRIAGSPSPTRTGYPSSYAIRDLELLLFPQPTTAITLYMDYYKRASTLVADGDANEWSTYAPYLIIGAAGSSMASTLGIADSKAEFDALASASQRTLLTETVLRETGNRSFQLGRNS